MRKAWFAYTAGSKGPEPVIFYDELPNEKNYLNPRILQKWELTKFFFTRIERAFDPDDDKVIEENEVTYSFDYMRRHFPYTGNEYDLGEKVTLEHKSDN